MFLQIKSIFTGKLIFKSVEVFRKMSNTSSSHLVNDPKYSFLKDLGLKATNNGVFNGQWKASGKVRHFPFIVRKFRDFCFILNKRIGNLCNAYEFVCR